MIDNTKTCAICGASVYFEAKCFPNHGKVQDYYCFECFEREYEDIVNNGEPLNNDPVNHPDHYTSRTMEAIDIIEMIIDGEQNPKVAYNMSNVLKYLLRFRKKGKSTEDLKKAKWYLDRMIQKVEEENDR